MILYYSATGNSAYVAKRIGEEVQDSVVNLFERIRTGDNTPMHSDTPWLICAPVFAWEMPKILEEWLGKTPLTGNPDVYFILTCGSSIGSGGSFARDLFQKKGMQFRGCLPIVMPDNYIPMYGPPQPEESKRIIAAAEAHISNAARCIRDNRDFATPKDNGAKKTFTGLMNRAFYALVVGAKKYHLEGKCTSCEKCVKVCPLQNIQLKDGKPVWGDRCTHCVACISYCPTEAIQYGSKTKNRVRYSFPRDYRR